MSDFLVIAGLVLLAVGLACWSVPLALVVFGVLFVVAGLWRHTHGDPGPPVPPPG